MTLSQKRAVRARLRHDANVLVANRGSVHYTQGAARWGWKRYPSGIHLPFYSDCSGTVTCLYWLALASVGHHADVLNGTGWTGGYTGTLARHGTKVSGLPGTRRVGDLVFYGSGWPWHHVAMVVAPDTVFSHGSEGGPYLLPIHYRRDVGQFRRYL